MSIVLEPNTKYIVLAHMELGYVSLDGSDMNLSVVCASYPQECLFPNVCRGICSGGGGQTWWGYVKTEENSLECKIRIHIPKELVVRLNMMAFSLL